MSTTFVFLVSFAALLALASACHLCYNPGGKTCGNCGTGGGCATKYPGYTCRYSNQFHCCCCSNGVHGYCAKVDGCLFEAEKLAENGERAVAIGDSHVLIVQASASEDEIAEAMNRFGAHQKH